jgi:hypothetical protein
MSDLEQRRFALLNTPQRITIVVRTLEISLVLDISAAAALLLISTAAFAQQIDQVKGHKTGAGCIGSLTTLSARLLVCTIDGPKSRIWCPNKQIFDRPGEEPSSFVVRSICSINQIL